MVATTLVDPLDIACHTVYMEQAHPQHDNGKPPKVLRFSAHDPLLKDTLMLLNAQGEKVMFQTKFEHDPTYLFSQHEMRRDTTDAVYHTDPRGYSLNNSIFSRYEMNVIDVSRRGLKSFRLGAEAATRTVCGADSSIRYVDLEIILDGQDVKRILSQPLLGALKHRLPVNAEIAARDMRENQQLAEMVERGRLPVTFQVDHMVEDENHRAMDRLHRVLRAGTYVSQLVTVPTQPKTPRHMPIFSTKHEERPYTTVADIDSFLDKTYGLDPINEAALSNFSVYLDGHDESLQRAD
jgi:hypothetical protein